MLEKEKNRRIKEADFTEWDRSLQRSVKQAGGK